MKQITDLYNEFHLIPTKRVIINYLIHSGGNLQGLICWIHLHLESRTNKLFLTNQDL